MVGQELAIELCKKIYEKLSGAGFYPALTGGQLYKEGQRKDIDILIYRNRQQVGFEISYLENQLADCGLTDFVHHGFVTKAKYKGVVVDLFNPETDESDCDYGQSSNIEDISEPAQPPKLKPAPAPAPVDIPW